MDVAAVTPPKPLPSELLLRHCLALGDEADCGPSARDRLELLLGSELAQRLVWALSTPR